MNIQHPDLTALVHSPFPYPHLDVHLIQDIAEKGKVWWTTDRQEEPYTPFPTLSLTIGNLLNTQWLNVHIGNIHNITEFKTHNERLYPATPISEDSTITNIFGVWYADHFTIPNSIRYDNLTPSQQLSWLLTKVIYITKQLDKALNKADQKKKAHSSDIDRLTYNLKTEIDRINSFAQTHQLPAPQELCLLESRYLATAMLLSPHPTDTTDSVTLQIHTVPSNSSQKVQPQKGFPMSTNSQNPPAKYDTHNQVYCPYPIDMNPQSFKAIWFTSYMGTTSPNSGEVSTNQAYLWNDANNFPALPYSMNDLVGSVWISPFDGHTETITSIIHCGEEPLLQTNIVTGPGTFAVLGRWISPERYTIDAIRYDTLTPDERLSWLLIAYEFTTMMLKIATTNSQPGNNDIPDYIRHSVPYQTLEKMKIAQYQSTQTAQVIAIQQLAQTNNLPIPTTLLSLLSSPTVLMTPIADGITTLAIADQPDTPTISGRTVELLTPGATNDAPAILPGPELAAPETTTPPVSDQTDTPVSAKPIAELLTPGATNDAPAILPGPEPTSPEPVTPPTSDQTDTPVSAKPTGEPTTPGATNDTPAILPSPEPAALVMATPPTSDQTDTPVSAKPTGEPTTPGATNDTPAILPGPEPAALVTPTPPASDQTDTPGSAKPTGEPTTPGATNDTPAILPGLEPAAPEPVTPPTTIQNDQAGLKYDCSATIHARPSEPDKEPKTLLADHKKDIEAQKAATNPFKANKAIPATLYTFLELLGSVWVSLTTAERKKVVAVTPIKTSSVQNRNRVYLLTDDPEPQYPTLGTYENGRYVIASHIRYDLLPITAKHKWHIEHLKYIQQQLSQTYYNYLMVTDTAKDNDPRKALIVDLEKELHGETEFAQAFATEHNLPLPADVLTSAETILAAATTKADLARQAKPTTTRPTIPPSAAVPTIAKPKPTRASTRPTPPPPNETEKGMLVYSPFAGLPPLPHVLTDSLRSAQHEQLTLGKTGQQSQSPLINRDLYAPTLWTLEQLIGSTWVNLYSGSKVMIKGFYIVYGHYHLTTEDITEKDWNITKAFGTYHHKTQRYYIEHWIRYDNLPPTTAVEWEAQPLRHAVSKCKQAEGEIATFQNTASRPSNWRSELNRKKHDLEAYTQEAVIAAKRLQDYALFNMIPIPADIADQDIIATYTTKKPRTKTAPTTKTVTSKATHTPKPTAAAQASPAKPSHPSPKPLLSPPAKSPTSTIATAPIPAEQESTQMTLF